MDTQGLDTSPIAKGRRPFSWPLHGWVGLLLGAVFWALNWGLDGPRTHWGFFPLWLGYCLTVDALVVRRKGDSILTRSPRGWIALFAISIPGWWWFEAVNLRTANWIYVGRELFSDLEYFLYASASFATVMPAVFGTAELVGTFARLRHFGNGPRWVVTPGRLRVAFAAGWIMLALLLAWPRYFFPFVWLSMFFVLEPLAVWLGDRSLVRRLEAGDWRPLVALGAGALVCGFFWEMWNFWSLPKWTYRVPFVDFARIFEMPLLGYGGYPPFALELFAMYRLVLALVRRGGRASPFGVEHLAP